MFHVASRQAREDLRQELYEYLARYWDASGAIEGKTPKRLELADKLLNEGLEKLGGDPEFCRRVSSFLEDAVTQRLEELGKRVRELEGPEATNLNEDPAMRMCAHRRMDQTGRTSAERGYRQHSGLRQL